MTPNPEQQLATLQEQVTNLQAQVMALQNVARYSRPKPILPDPVKFDGKAYHFDTWLGSIESSPAEARPNLTVVARGPGT